MMNLTGKTALITGASRGIGRAIATMYADHGCNIAFTYINEENEAKLLTELLLSKGVQVVCIQSDASQFQAAHDVVKQVVDTFGKIDILVCNAGITRDTLIMRMSEQQWDDVINNNLKSAFNFTHAVTPIMAKQRGGSIINMSSVVGVSGNAGQCNYSASKAGMIGLAKSIAKEMGPRGIRANAIAPGFLVSAQNKALLFDDNGNPTPRSEKILKGTPANRFVDAKELLGATLFLCDEGCASAITGVVLPIDCGFAAYSGV